MKNYKQVIAVNEIVGAIADPFLTSEDVKNLKSDPTNFLQAKCAVEFNGEIAVVENSANEVHMTLPYYSQVEAISSYELSPEDMQAVVGGEILISVFAAIGVGVGAVIASAAGTVGLSSIAIIVGCGSAGAIAGGAIAATAGTAIVRGEVEGRRIDGSKK